MVQSLVPEVNSLTFFQVSTVSFHQVREVLAENKTRLSLGERAILIMRRSSSVVNPE